MIRSAVARERFLKYTQAVRFIEGTTRVDSFNFISLAVSALSGPLRALIGLIMNTSGNALKQKINKGS